jgi:hypothetical protein
MSHNIYAQIKVFPTSGFCDVPEKLIRDPMTSFQLGKLLSVGEAIYSAIILEVGYGSFAILFITTLTNIYEIRYSSSGHNIHILTKYNTTETIITYSDFKLGHVVPKINIIHKNTVLTFDDAILVNDILFQMCKKWTHGQCYNGHFTPGENNIRNIIEFMKAIEMIYDEKTRQDRIKNMLSLKKSFVFKKDSLVKISDISTDNRELIDKQKKLAEKRIDLDNQKRENNIISKQKLQEAMTNNSDLINERNVLESECFELKIEAKKLNDELSKECEKRKELECSKMSLTKDSENISQISDEISEKSMEHHDILEKICRLKQEIKKIESIAMAKHIRMQKKVAQLKIMSHELNEDITRLEKFTKDKIHLSVESIVNPLL